MRSGMVWTLVALLGAAGCGQAVEGPAPTFSVGQTGGSYALTAVDGQALPAVAYFGVDVSVRALSGTLALAADHTYALSLDYTQHLASGNRDRSFTQQESGRWSAMDRGLQLSPEGHSARQAAVSGDTLTVTLTVADESPPERATKAYTFVRTR